VLAPAGSSGTITGYAVGSNGGLAESGVPITVTNLGYFADIDSQRRFLYAATASGIVGYSIDQSTGELMAVPGSPYSQRGVTGIAVMK
jgi:hypothetical protein